MSKLAPLAAVIAALLVPGVAHAQTAPPPQTLTANGTGEADVTPADADDEASIRAAVDAANAEALPLAIADARKNAAALAAAAGVTLGPMVSIQGGGSYPFGGSFGPGKFCGDVPNRKTVVRNGRRRSVRVKGTHRVCRVPREIYSSVQLTFSIT